MWFLLSLFSGRDLVLVLCFAAACACLKCCDLRAPCCSFFLVIGSVFAVVVVVAGSGVVRVFPRLVCVDRLCPVLHFCVLGAPERSSIARRSTSKLRDPPQTCDKVLAFPNCVVSLSCTETKFSIEGKQHSKLAE